MEYTVRELAQQWGVAPATVRYTLAQSGALGAGVRRVGGTLLVSGKARRLAESWRRHNARK